MLVYWRVILDSGSSKDRAPELWLFDRPLDPSGILWLCHSIAIENGLVEIVDLYTH